MISKLREANILEAYEIYRNDGDINRILDSINDMYTIFSACHGKYHAMAVVSMTEYILTALGYNGRTIELGKIAALLHDIGNIAGRWKHAEKSAALAEVFLGGTVPFSAAEREMIIQAIADHSGGDNISSPIGAAVLMADKLDISKHRILPRAKRDHWHENLLKVEAVNLDITGKNITINCITAEGFCMEMLLSETGNFYKMPMKAAAYLGCSCRFLHTVK